MSEAIVCSALANDKRLQILEWLKDPEAHFPPQRDGDLVKDGVCVLFIADKLGEWPSDRDCASAETRALRARDLEARPAVDVLQAERARDQGAEARDTRRALGLPLCLLAHDHLAGSHRPILARARRRRLGLSRRAGRLDPDTGELGPESPHRRLGRSRTSRLLQEAGCTLKDVVSCLVH